MYLSNEYKDYFFHKYPKLLCLLYGAINAKACGILQINHLCNTQLNIFNRLDIIFMYLSPIISFLLMQIGLIDNTLLSMCSLILLIISVLDYFYFFNSVTSQAAGILGMKYRFFIDYKKEYKEVNENKNKQTNCI